MTAVLDVAVAVLLIAGALLSLTAAVGLHRLPDVFCRMHAASKPATLGLLVVLLAAALALGDLRSATKLALVAILQFLTNPVGGHMVGRAAWRAQDAGAESS
ncbi:MAG TPA: monovalent cation/H(+) antiporter subunit G [Egibacteraceae bacterium]|nr:monovalent cation/H(+) antiporter subunit G [Egibacteraceae bacterium]